MICFVYQYQGHDEDIICYYQGLFLHMFVLLLNINMYVLYWDLVLSMDIQLFSNHSTSTQEHIRAVDINLHPNDVNLFGIGPVPWSCSQCPPCVVYGRRCNKCDSRVFGTWRIYTSNYKCKLTGIIYLLHVLTLMSHMPYIMSYKGMEVLAFIFKLISQSIFNLHIGAAECMCLFCMSI